MGTEEQKTEFNQQMVDTVFKSLTSYEQETGNKVSDSDMFIYCGCYTGNYWHKKKPNLKQAA